MLINFVIPILVLQCRYWNVVAMVVLERHHALEDVGVQMQLSLSSPFFSLCLCYSHSTCHPDTSGTVTRS